MADPFPKPDQNFFIEKNRSSENDITDFYKKLTNYRRFDALIVEENVDDFSNKYKVNLHGYGLGSKYTHHKLIGINPDIRRLYRKGMICSVMFDGKVAIMLPIDGPLDFVWYTQPTELEKATYPRRFWGFPSRIGQTSYYKGADKEFEVSIVAYTNYLNGTTGGGIRTYAYAAPQLKNGEGRCLGFQSEQPFIVQDEPSSGLSGGVPNRFEAVGIIPSSSAAIPGSGKYKVLTILDDAGTQGFDFIRFSEDTL